jgi:1,4-alpha-glucan branching enzyme
MIRRSVTGDDVKVTFSLPAAYSQVSVVGDFNAWTPGVHTLVKRSNGTRSVSITLPAGSVHRFRYLAEPGQWFDDPEADVHTHDGGLIRA